MLHSVASPAVCDVAIGGYAAAEVQRERESERARRRTAIAFVTAAIFTIVSVVALPWITYFLSHSLFYNIFWLPTSCDDGPFASVRATIIQVLELLMCGEGCMA